MLTLDLTYRKGPLKTYFTPMNRLWWLTERDLLRITSHRSAMLQIRSEKDSNIRSNFSQQNYILFYILHNILPNDHID